MNAPPAAAAAAVASVSGSGSSPAISGGSHARGAKEQRAGVPSSLATMVADHAVLVRGLSLEPGACAQLLQHRAGAPRVNANSHARRRLQLHSLRQILRVVANRTRAAMTPAELMDTGGPRALNGTRKGTHAQSESRKGTSRVSTNRCLSESTATQKRIRICAQRTARAELGTAGLYAARATQQRCDICE